MPSPFADTSDVGAVLGQRKLRTVTVRASCSEHGQHVIALRRRSFEETCIGQKDAVHKRLKRLRGAFL